MENLNLATNAELKKRQEELQTEFDETKLFVAKYMLHLEELEKNTWILKISLINV